MSHDLIKVATRKRMAETSEPYSVARRAVIRQHQGASRSEDASGAARSRAFQMVAEQFASNAGHVHRSLRSASGVDEIERRFKAVRWFRALGHSVDDRPSGIDADMGRPWWGCQRCGSDLQLDGTGGWASSTGTGRCLHEGASW